MLYRKKVGKRYIPYVFSLNDAANTILKQVISVYLTALNVINCIQNT
ncbi:hypothetical protein [Bacillus niameyensis]|nr:hypothetical protein [Bacillus niameyensis]